MNLLLHIAKKDLRQSWALLAATLALFLLTTWTLSAPRQPRSEWVDLETVVLVTWMIATGMLWQREPLPGQRAYWFARPLRWQDLLQAKSIVVAVAIFLPILATHAIVVAANGLPVAPNLPALAWNAAMIVALYILPVAVLAAITRNLQQLILWVLAIFAAGILAMQAYPIAPQTFAIANTVTNALNIVALLAILIWQYRTRSTRAGRMVVIALTLVLRALPNWLPEPAWFALQRVFSPAHPIQFELRPESINFRNDFRAGFRPLIQIPISFAGLALGQTVEFTGFHHTLVTAGGEQTTDAEVRRPPGATDLSVLLPREFGRRHQQQPYDLSFTAELTVYEAPRTFSVAVGESIDIPGFGRCQSWSDGYLRVQCQTVLGTTDRVDGRWAAKDPATNSLAVLSIAEDGAPLAGKLTPVTILRGGFQAQSVYSNGRIYINLRKPIAHVQRRIELTGIRE